MNKIIHRRGKPLLFFLWVLIFNNYFAFAQDNPLTQRQIVLNEMSVRPNDPWPRGDGHILLAEPGSPVNQKAYLEPGGSFSPSPGSFGMAIWILGDNNKLIATSDNIPIENIQQQYIWKEGNKIPSIKTQTPYYNCIWTYNEMGLWQFELNKTDKSDNKIQLVFRSVGPAGGPVQSVIWDKTRLIINHRWKVTPDDVPSAIIINDEEKKRLMTDIKDNESIISTNGWAFAKIELSKPTISLSINDTKPLFKSPLFYDKTIAHFQFDLPDKRFGESLNAQISNLMMGYVGRQTCPGEPVNYPLAWERDGAYSLMAMARSGNIQTAKELSVYFAENDYFGGFGAEGDAPGSAINTLSELAFLLDDPEYYNWVWTHIQRKLGLIDEMMNATENVYKNYIGPIAPHLQNDLLRRQLICMKTENDLIYGTMDLHFPILYINAISYRGLMQASRIALKLNKQEIATQCIEKANKIKSAWLKGFGLEKYDNERNFMISVWPSWITNKGYELFVEKIIKQRHDMWSNGVPKERPLWTYFAVSEAHQWLFLDRPELTWETLNYFWNNQCSPGLYSYWEGNGEENSFKQWVNYRGWLKPKYVTPHYWTASEMVLLQLDMLAYFDESGNEPILVIGGGIPKNWIDQKMNVENYKTKFGTVSWYYVNNSLKVVLQGSKIKCKVRAGVSFNENLITRIEYKK